MLEALERSGRRDDTIVVVTADHGDMLGSHRLFNKGFHMYEETHRVPLLISGPGAERGTEAAAFANLVDLAPTLLELAAAETAGRRRRTLPERRCSRGARRRTGRTTCSPSSTATKPPCTAPA